MVRLPAEYQEVEYIQSARGDSQWIDTGIPITYSLVMEITFAVVSVVANYYVMGEYANNNGAFYLYTSSKFQTAYGCSYANTTVNADTEKHTFRYSFDNANTIVSENGQQILSKSKISPLATSSSIKIAGSKIRNQLSCKTYSFVAYDNGVKVADFIPCYRKLDSKPGMYDLVTETFLVNQGTGEDFTVGPDVIDSISPWMVARRRLLMAQNRQEIIGYEENKGFTSDGNYATIGNLSGFFITGFIPLGSTTKIQAKYSSNGYSNNSQKFVCEYNGSKTYNSGGYWSMTVANERTVEVYTQSAEYIRFCGRLDSIDECFVKDANTGVVLWKKGM